MVSHDFPRPRPSAADVGYIQYVRHSPFGEQVAPTEKSSSREILGSDFIMVTEGKTGRILAGESAGWYIRVEKDETGCYFIYTFKNADFTGVWGEIFDEWVPDWDGVLAYFARPELEIDWDFDTWP